jgi:hypothetical protein
LHQCAAFISNLRGTGLAILVVVHDDAVAVGDVADLRPRRCRRKPEL